MRINDTAYLCGYFSIKSDEMFDPMAVQPDFWKSQLFLPEEIVAAKDFYYPEFADFMMTEVQTYSHRFDKDVKVILRGGREHKLHLEEVKLHCFPFGIVMYSIKVVQNDVEMQDALDALFMLRNLPVMSEKTMGEYMSLAIAPLMELNRKSGNAGDPRSLIECGNKQKLFHTVILSEQPKDSEDFDHLLYGAGTLSVFKKDDAYGFSKEYYDGIMSSSSLNVFNSWRALSLLDIFTMVAYDVKDYMLNVWHEEYFAKLYIYTLFKKFFLFRINGDFRSGSRDIKLVRKDLTKYEKNYEFHKILYNFLPELVIHSMEKGLDMEDEKLKLADMIERENKRKEEETNDKMNLFLGMITCLTLFSAIWDFACLMDGVFEFSANIGTVTGIRACTMVLLSITCFLLLLAKRKK